MSSPSADERVPTLGVAVLGSTGSIGRQALDVLSRLGDRFRVVALAAGGNRELLEEQVAQHRPAATSLATDDPEGLEALASRDDVDLVVVATAGIVSLRPVLAALRAGKIVATANKETLVAGGHLVMPVARRLAAARIGSGDRSHPLASPLGWLRPIDSEHSAIWQCLAGEDLDRVERLILTASGGPFLDEPDDLSSVTPEMALRHPTWRMGSKITVDSATLANKGLEVIEARWLYDVPYDAIAVVVHPQSVVHSAVEFVDGSLKAQLGTPDMRLPIQYALTYPDRHPSPAASPDLLTTNRLDFRPPDEGRFPALRIAREAGQQGPRASAALIAADEVAVSRFLAGTLGFAGIPRLLEAAVARFGAGPEPGVGELLELDREVRDAFAAGATGSAA
jgi:1-deoxy-D-xylulose-5-phosphate reductoisomerase